VGSIQRWHPKWLTAARLGSALPAADHPGVSRLLSSFCFAALFLVALFRSGVAMTCLADDQRRPAKLSKQ
jgi:hypothetical protein